VVDNVVKPRFMQEGFDMGPFMMFAAILFWAYVLGPTGALLAVPLTTAVRRMIPADGDAPASPVPSPAPSPSPDAAPDAPPDAPIRAPA
jgi:hypothetical protein